MDEATSFNISLDYLHSSGWGRAWLASTWVGWFGDWFNDWFGSWSGGWPEAGMLVDWSSEACLSCCY
jgi:hypothetical protein